MRKFVGMTRYISCAICTLLLFLSLASGNTFSFQEGSQRARNDAQNLSSKANVRLIKLENDTGEKLSGAVFSLYKTDGTLLFENLVTDENGEIFAAVTAGDYYFEEQTPPEGYDFMRDENNAPVTCHPFTVTEAQEQNGETIEMTVENRKAKVGTLTITKTVRNSDGSALTEEQSKQEFNFTVTFSVGGSYYFTVQNISGEEVRHGTLESGKKVMLRHGESAKFYSVSAENNWYSVTETQTDGYTSASTGEAGWVIESGSEAAFTNIYTVPAPPEPTPDPTPTPEPEPTTEPEPVPKPDSDVPQTDDSRKPVLWLSLIVIGVAGLCCCGLYVKKHLRRRKKRTVK